MGVYLQVEGKKGDSFLVGTTVHQELGIGERFVEISTAELGITHHYSIP